MPNETEPVAVVAADGAPRARPSNYPEPFASMMQGRVKRQLGEVFGVSRLGVNLSRMDPGSISALRHSHSMQVEFVYIPEGSPTLITESGEIQLGPGMCAGFRAWEGGGHHLVNRSGGVVVYLEVGDRTAGDTVFYPDDDIEAEFVDGAWLFRDRNGQAFQ